MGNKALTVAFAGGGTGGHIYPGLAVADFFRQKLSQAGRDVQIVWIGSLSKMDRQIVSNSRDRNGALSADVFYGVPSGKLRRYFSLRNFLDAFKIFFGFAASFFILLKIRPAFLFSKGGFVSVPPCIAARVLGIKVFTHECDFSPGLATKINSRFASKILLSYKETQEYFSASFARKFIVTGNPVRPVFYSADEDAGLKFLGMTREQKKAKPILFAMGGSLGAKQINELVWKNLSWLCERWTVVHQTGQKNEACLPQDLTENEKASYHPYAFIYSQMPDVLAAADVVISRAGANSIWECAVLHKPMILIPLEGAGTRGDQVDNARYFERNGAAIVLTKSSMTETSMQSALASMASAQTRKKFSEACEALLGQEKPAQKIADILAEEAV